MARNIGNCLDAALDAVDTETKETVKKRWKEYNEAAELDNLLNPAEAERFAAKKIEEELEFARVQRKRNMKRHVLKTNELNERLFSSERVNFDPDTNLPLNPEEFAKEAYSILSTDPTFRSRGPNLESRYKTHRRQAWALATNFLDKFRKKYAGVMKTHKPAEELAVAKHLFGEAVDDMEAKGIAEGLKGANDYLVKRLKMAGSNLQLREDWGWSQKHDVDKMTGGAKRGTEAWQKAKDDWVEFTISRLGLDKMGTPDDPITLRNAYELLDTMFDERTAAKPYMTGTDWSSPISKRQQHRELVFKNAEAWYEYNEKYGAGSLFDAAIERIDKLAMDVATLEILGPYPNASLNEIKKLLPTEAQQTRLDHIYDNVTGASNRIFHEAGAKAWLTKRSADIRNLQTAGMLGSSVFTAVPSDIVTMRATAKLAGLPWTKAFGQYLKQLNPANAAHRREAARLGFVAQMWTDRMSTSHRLLSESLPMLKTAKFADFVLRGQGLGAHTEGMRNGFKVMALGQLTEYAMKGTKYADLPEALRMKMKDYDIGKTDWDMYRETPIWTDPETGGEWIRPDDIFEAFESAPNRAVGEREQRYETSHKFLDMLNTEGIFAVVEPTARSKVAGIWGHRAGTFGGELARHVLLFRSFLMAFTYFHGSRAANTASLNRVRSGSKFAKLVSDARKKSGESLGVKIGTGLIQGYEGAKYLVPMAALMTFGYAIQSQLREIAKGNDPREMNGKFWGEAVANGGGLGIFGELVNLTQSLIDRGPKEALVQLLGVTAQTLVNDLGTGAAKAIGSDTEGAGTAELMTGAKKLLPGTTLWYARMALERLVYDQIEKMLDPRAKARWKRSAKWRKDTFNQKLWWEKGKTAPSRAPDLSKMIPN